MKYLAVAAHLAIVICAIDQQYRTPPKQKPAPQKYCYGYIPGWTAAVPCAWLPLTVEV